MQIYGHVRRIMKICATEICIPILVALFVACEIYGGLGNSPNIYKCVEFTAIIVSFELLPFLKSAPTFD